MKDIKDGIIEYLFACVILLIGVVVMCIIFAHDTGKEIKALEQENGELKDSIKVLNEYLDYD